MNTVRVHVLNVRSRIVLIYIARLAQFSLPDYLPTAVLLFDPELSEGQSIT